MRLQIPCWIQTAQEPVLYHRGRDYPCPPRIYSSKRSLTSDIHWNKWGSPSSRRLPPWRWMFPTLWEENPGQGYGMLRLIQDCCLLKDWWQKSRLSLYDIIMILQEVKVISTGYNHYFNIIWASTQEKLPLGFPKKRDSNQSLLLQKRIMKFRSKQVKICFFPEPE